MAVVRETIQKPRAKALPMRQGTVGDIVGQALLRKRGASTSELAEILHKRFPDRGRPKPAAITGQLWTLRRRGYGMDTDNKGRFWLVLPSRATGLTYSAEPQEASRRRTARNRQANEQAARSPVKRTATTRARKAAKAAPAPRARKAKGNAEPAPRAASRATKRAATTSRKPVASRARKAAAPKRSRAGAIVAAEKGKRVRKRKAKAESLPADDNMNPTFRPVEGYEHATDKIDTGREYPSYDNEQSAY